MPSALLCFACSNWAHVRLILTLRIEGLWPFRRHMLDGWSLFATNTTRRRGLVPAKE